MLKLTTKKDVINLGIGLAILEALFCVMFGWIIMSSADLFPNGSASVLQIGLALLLMVIGVGGSGLIVFGYPAYLAFQGQKEQAVTLVISTIISLILVTIVLVVIGAGIVLLVG
ncbi:MAG: hypothetical protein ABH826_00455 [Patescibacteria group bacterium]